MRGNGHNPRRYHLQQMTKHLACSDEVIFVANFAVIKTIFEEFEHTSKCRGCGKERESNFIGFHPISLQQVERTIYTSWRGPEGIFSFVSNTDRIFLP